MALPSYSEVSKSQLRGLGVNDAEVLVPLEIIGLTFMSLWDRATYALFVKLALTTKEVFARAAVVAGSVGALEDA